MKYPFKTILILYNPISTGGSRQNALRLRRQLKEALGESVAVRAQKTQYAGHAEEIASQHAERDARTLIVSSSGDGGYHEVINGAAAHQTRHLTVAVLPSGNANDHYHATAETDFLARVVAAKTRQIDILEVDFQQAGQPQRRYAHSYIGVGLTAYIIKRLNKIDLNPINEKWLVLKYLLRFGHVALKFAGETSWRRYSNLIVANIDRMSKVIKLSEHTRLDDGKFELYLTPRQSVRQTLRVLLRGAMFGLEPRKRTDRVEFTARRRSELQCDGEVYPFDGGVPVRIVSRRQKLKTLA